MHAAPDTAALPDDPAALRALLLAARAERDSALAERDALEAQNDRLRHLLLKLRRAQFGRSVNRIKLLKRTMYGRAGFGLLRARVLHAA